MAATATYRGGGYLFGDTNVSLSGTSVRNSPLLVACSQYGSTPFLLPYDSQGNDWRLEQSKLYGGVKLFVWSTPQTTAITGTIGLTGDATNAVLWSAWQLSDVDYETVTSTRTVNKAGGPGGPVQALAAGVGLSVGFVAATSTDTLETWSSSQNLNTPPSIYDSALSSNGVADDGNTSFSVLWSTTEVYDACSVTVCMRLKRFRPRGRTVLQASKRAAFR